MTVLLFRKKEDPLPPEDSKALDRLILEGHKTAVLVRLFGLTRSGINGRRRRLQGLAKPRQSVKRPQPEENVQPKRLAVLPVACSDWMTPITREQLMRGR